MWSAWPTRKDWARRSMLSLDPPLANPEDMTIPRCAADADMALEILREYLRRWIQDRAAMTAPAAGSV